MLAVVYNLLNFSNIMELGGKVIKILDAQRFVSQRNGVEYVRHTFIVETGGEYPKRVAFSVMGDDKFSKMGIVVGSSYNVSFDISSREYQGRWFTQCDAWRVVCLDGAASAAPAVASTQESVSSSNDMPF